MLAMPYDNWKSWNNVARELYRYGLNPSSAFVFQKFSISEPIRMNLRISLRIRTMIGLFIYAAQTGARKFAETFKEIPAIQKPNTFTIDDAIAKMSEAGGGGSH